MTTEQIKGTPLTLIHDDQENMYYITLGNYAIYRNESKDECIKNVQEKSWEILYNFCIMITDQTLKHKQNETERKS